MNWPFYIWLESYLVNRQVFVVHFYLYNTIGFFLVKPSILRHKSPQFGIFQYQHLGCMDVDFSHFIQLWTALVSIKVCLNYFHIWFCLLFNMRVNHVNSRDNFGNVKSIFFLYNWVCELYLHPIEIGNRDKAFIDFAHKEETTHLCKIWTWE
jgi:hypothetical protein